MACKRGLPEGLEDLRQKSQGPSEGLLWAGGDRQTDKWKFFLLYRTIGGAA